MLQQFTSFRVCCNSVIQGPLMTTGIPPYSEGCTTASVAASKTGAADIEREVVCVARDPTSTAEKKDVLIVYFPRLV